MTTFYLREIAHARSGDKGDTNNIGVIAYEPDFYPIIVQQITPDAVKKHFGDLVKGPVTRYELPRVDAINLVLANSLGGGVTRSLSHDPHGKSYSALILSMPIEVSADLAVRLQAAGRKPIQQP
ncbi:MAG: hypothetical protein ACI9DC_001482 [Gammaproteobacteria bacterium]|jgi:hypothetical protein